MSHQLSRDEYDRIRSARDTQARAAQLIDKPDCCSGCGGEYTNTTTGCDQCWDRERRRKRRQDPAKHQQDLHIWRETHRRRRERKAAIA